MAAWFTARRGTDNRFVLTGDLNVAPLPTDVWSHQQLLTVVSHTPAETAALASRHGVARLGGRGAPLRPAGGEALFLVELPRPRLVGVRPGAAARPHLGHARRSRRASARPEVLREARGWPKPSDHAPVCATLAP